jgi:DNA polymerase/3'-5' exonuclease PolX
MSEKPKILLKKKIELKPEPEIKEKPEPKIKLKPKAPTSNNDNEKPNSTTTTTTTTKSTKMINLMLQKKADQEDIPNKKIVELLTKLAVHITAENKTISDKSEKTKNEFRLRSMWKAIQTIKEHQEEIRSGDEAKELKGIGKGIADRIDEIMETGTLKELQNEVLVNEESKAVDDLITINGIGEKTALRFYQDYGIKSVADLMERWRTGKFKIEKYKLTHHIELGLKYYDDFRVRIPREEIDNFNMLVNTLMKDIDSKLIYEIAGSYRRKKPDSGDIDILMSHPDLKTKADLEKSKKNYLALLVEKLMDEGLLIDHMDEDFSSYYKGVILLDKIPRRIDIMIIPYSTWAAALMHNTGSGPFNQRIRAHAMMRGYHLSQHGLYKVTNGQKEENPIETTTEKQIFDTLGVVYLKPEDRD